MEEKGFIHLFFNPEVAARYMPDLLHGMWITLCVSVLVVVTGLVMGLILAILRLISPRILQEVIRLWVDCMRALPPLVVILILFFGLPSLGIRLSAFWVIWLTLSCILAAFAEEIFWAGITSIGKGQWEAARSTGMNTSETLAYVVLPQAFRLCVPPLTNRAIAITKNSALGTAVGMPELLSAAQTAQSFSGNATPLILATIGYLVIFIPMMAFAARLERRMQWGRG